MSLDAIPISFAEASAFVLSFHRHNRPPRGSLFQVACSDGDRMVGVAITGRPIARMLQDGVTAEVLRVCVLDDAPLGTCSFLYATSWRAARALGWRRLVTYTLGEESGASLRGAGWKTVAELPPRSPEGAWKGPDRRRGWQPVYGQQKLRWEVAA